MDTSGHSGTDTGAQEKVFAVLADVFGLPREEVGPETVREDIPEWDSLGHLNLMLALEEAFDVSFSVEEMPELVSVDAIVQKVQAKWPSS
jgi:acyl carrier protein